VSAVKIMAIARWHYGKIVLLWAWGLALMGVVFVSIQTLSHPNSTAQLVFAFLLLGLLGAIPLALSVVTWKWLGGKEVEVTAPVEEEPKSDSAE
jgi:predicted membrane channel-forming protein YqfA (hemolysin III family)